MKWVIAIIVVCALYLLYSKGRDRLAGAARTATTDSKGRSGGSVGNSGGSGNGNTGVSASNHNTSPRPNPPNAVNPGGGNNSAMTGMVVAGGVPFDVVWVPTGTMSYGAAGEPESDTDEAPGERQVGQTFAVGRTEVTVEQFNRLMRPNEPVDGARAKLPVTKVSFGEAVDFCMKLTASSEARARRYKFRLPNELEWEYACRAGSRTMFAVWGEHHDIGHLTQALDEYASGDRAAFLRRARSSFNFDQGKAVRVGSYPPNAWDICDMHGNVAEWCEIADGRAMRAGANPFTDRPVRGGSWVGPNPFQCRSANRDVRPRTTSNDSVGFRVALEIVP
jgi:formylglycine-generating enzyme required for sulfatase activity